MQVYATIEKIVLTAVCSYVIPNSFHTAAGSRTTKKCHGINVQVMKTFSFFQKNIVNAGKANGSSRRKEKACSPPPSITSMAISSTSIFYVSCLFPSAPSTFIVSHTFFFRLKSKVVNWHLYNVILHVARILQATRSSFPACVTFISKLNVISDCFWLKWSGQKKFIRSLCREEKLTQ